MYRNLLAVLLVVAVVGSVPAFCSKCSKWKACVGGCRAASEQLGMDMTAVDPIDTQYTTQLNPIYRNQDMTL